MILFFSGGGGSRNYNPETVLDPGPVMLTFFTCANKENVPDHRFGDIVREKRLAARRKNRARVSTRTAD